MPIEISSLLYHFLKKGTSNCMRAKVTGKKMREIGLVVPTSFEAYTKSKKDAITLDKELAKRKEMFSTFDIKHKQKRFYRRFLIYDVYGGKMLRC